MKISPLFQTIIKSFSPDKGNNQDLTRVTNCNYLKSKLDHSSISKESKDIQSLSNAFSTENNEEVRRIYSKLLKIFEHKDQTNRFIDNCKNLLHSGSKNHIHSFKLASKLDNQGLQSHLWFQNMETMNKNQIDQYLKQTEDMIMQEDEHETKRCLINNFILATSRIAHVSEDFDQEYLLGDFLKGIDKFDGTLDKMDYISLFLKASQ